jgi:hypothetical protein
MDIEQIKDKIVTFKALPNRTYQQNIYLAKLQSAARLNLHVIPHLTSLNGHEIEFRVTETNEDATNEQLDCAGIDGLFVFKHVGISAAYASRTWTLTNKTPRCGGALIRFCRDRGTTPHEMQLRSQKLVTTEDELRIKTEQQEKRWLDPRPVRFHEEAIKLMTGDLLGLHSTFTANYFVSSYFRNTCEQQRCERFSVVPVAELSGALRQLYSEIMLGNATLLDLSHDMITNWRLPYVASQEEFEQVEKSLGRDPRVTLLRKPQNNGGFVRFLYLRREFLESACPSFQVWKDGVLQPRLSHHPVSAVATPHRNDAKRARLESLMPPPIS